MRQRGEREYRDRETERIAQGILEETNELRLSIDFLDFEVSQVAPRTRQLATRGGGGGGERRLALRRSH